MISIFNSLQMPGAGAAFWAHWPICMFECVILLLLFSTSYRKMVNGEWDAFDAQQWSKWISHLNHSSLFEEFATSLWNSILCKIAISSFIITKLIRFKRLLFFLPSIFQQWWKCWPVRSIVHTSHIAHIKTKYWHRITFVLLSSLFVLQHLPCTECMHHLHHYR